MTVVVNQPVYSQSFYNLVHEVLDAKGWKQKNLEESILCDRKTISRAICGTVRTKKIILLICVALGLDLVSTMIFLISCGFILNPIDSDIDYKYMLFIDQSKTDGLKRIMECNEYIQE